MPKHFSWAAAAAIALALGLAGPSNAAVLPVNGTLRVLIDPIGGISLTGSAIGTSNGAFGLATVPSGLIDLTGTASAAITPPALGLGKITVMGPVQNAPASFNPAGAMANDAIANLFFTSGPAGGSVPLSPIGGGGTAMALVSGLPVTVVGGIWSNLGVSAGDPTRTIMVSVIASGIPLTVTASAYDKRGTGGGGTVQLVAPALIKIFGGNLGSMPVVGVLTLQFVPEPGTLMLVGFGLVGLVAFRRGSTRR